MVDSWLFMKSPLPVTFILMFYLYFVLKGGPSWMENREPFQLTNLLIFYNAYQVLFSIWLCSHALSVNITPVFTNTFTDSDQDFPISVCITGSNLKNINIAKIIFLITFFS